MKLNESIKIETSNGHFEIFKVIPINCKIGETVWFEDTDCYLEGIVMSIDPNDWWIYEDGTKTLGTIEVRCNTVSSPYYNHVFEVEAKNILYKKPEGYDEYWSEGDDVTEYGLGYQQGYQDAIEKACEWLEKCDSLQMRPYNISEFRKSLENEN